MNPNINWCHQDYTEAMQLKDPSKFTKPLNFWTVKRIQLIPNAFMGHISIPIYLNPKIILTSVKKLKYVNKYRNGGTI